MSLIRGLVINSHGIFPITDNSGTIYDLLALQPGYAAGNFFVVSLIQRR